MRRARTGVWFIQLLEFVLKYLDLRLKVHKELAVNISESPEDGEIILAIEKGC
jgi:hypothetical protein